MTEQQWLQTTGPGSMLDFLRDKASDRKLRLFAVACVRRIWDRLHDERSRTAVEVAERFADGKVTDEERAAAHAAAYSSSREVFADAAALAGGDAAACAEAASYARGLSLAVEGEAEAQCRLLRCIFGAPFRPLPPLAPSVLQWNAGTVKRLAEATYEERFLPSGHLDPQRLAVLIDAVEEAGCTAPEILGHLRGPGPHYRGCHILDLLLGKS